MKDLTGYFSNPYHPQKALVIYRQDKGDGIYIEGYDIDRSGRPINAHPLNVQEARALAQALDISEEPNRSFLHPKGLLPRNVLYLNPSGTGYVIWHTPAMRASLLFKRELAIPNGEASLPPLLWKASRDSLCLYALKTASDIGAQTKLYRAPFFNIYEEGEVCMGTVSIEFERGLYLEGFMQRWQDYFFKSYFSHLLGDVSPVNGNIVQLWQRLVGSKRKFPVSVLKKHSITLQHLLR